ncbi:PqqD family protein [Cyclobacterium amurskyense]|mgnify:FL=1|uniref:PqqD family protein n=1 Tax=Cyclobacterium amurskyense TaxID=320787 RepID=UPI0030DC6FC8|tara:strand:- start:3237 stop:3506 length:270 start_codon:yes stop_codon:yes gene_type:complete
MSSKQISRSDSYVFNEIEGDIVMMDVSNGSYATLNETGKSIWLLLENPKTIGEITEALLAEYEVSKEQCEKTVNEFLKKMAEANAIVIK